MAAWLARLSLLFQVGSAPSSGRSARTPRVSTASVLVAAARLEPYARFMWEYYGQRRPPFAAEPGPGQESVWDYPRPPRLESVKEPLLVRFAGRVLAQTQRGHRLLETSHPPVYYFPPEDVADGILERLPGQTFCEYKGLATYYDVVADGRRASRGAFSYHGPVPEYAALDGHVGFYAGAMDACFVGDEQVTPQPGDYYAGWVTRSLAGPFKGEAGTRGW